MQEEEEEIKPGTAEILERKLRQVRLLLGKAEGNGVTAEERIALTGKAAELIARYGIDRAILAAEGRHPDEITEKNVHVFDPQGREKREMLGLLAEAMGCTALYQRLSVRVDDRACAVCILIGYESDISRAEIMFSSLLLQMWSELRLAKRPESESRGKFTRSFVLAYGDEAARRVNAAEAGMRRSATMASAAGKAPPGMALVLRSRAQAVADALEERYPSPGKGRAPTAGSYAGHSAGTEAARRADIGGPRVAQGREKALA